MSVEMAFKPKRVRHHELIWRDPICFIATGFGVGAFPYMPGTIATIAAIPLYLMLVQLGWWWYGVIVVLMTLLGVYVCQYANQLFGTDDHPAAVWDEYVGYLVAMFGVPVHGLAIVLGFVIFRFLDIVKPGPIGWLDRNIHGGLGVMLDDVVSGVVTAIILNVLFHFILINAF